MKRQKPFGTALFVFRYSGIEYSLQIANGAIAFMLEGQGSEKIHKYQHSQWYKEKYIQFF